MLQSGGEPYGGMLQAWCFDGFQAGRLSVVIACGLDSVIVTLLHVIVHRDLRCKNLLAVETQADLYC